MTFRKLHVVLILAIVACLTPIFLLQRDLSEPHYELVPVAYHGADWLI